MVKLGAIKGICQSSSDDVGDGTSPSSPSAANVAVASDTGACNSSSASSSPSRAAYSAVSSLKAKLKKPSQTSSPSSSSTMEGTSSGQSLLSIFNEDILFLILGFVADVPFEVMGSRNDNGGSLVIKIGCLEDTMATYLADILTTRFGFSLMLLAS
eukprot:scaffold2864_cov184-Alexandrium_tamarense.AAC.2